MECKICGKELVGKQKVYCSNSCKFDDKELNHKRCTKHVLNDSSKRIKCNKCGFISKDIHNISGALTRHAKTHNSEYNILDFSIIEFNKKQWECPICHWKTIDISNKSGCITNHINNVHNLTKLEFNNKFDKYINNSFIERKNETLKDDYLICKECGTHLQSITFSHLKLHNMTVSEYKNKWNISGKIINNNLCENLNKYKEKSFLNHVPKYISKGECEIKQFLEEKGIKLLSQYRKLGIEIDLYSEEYKIGIEYDGLLWHSELYGKKDKSYHLNKTEIAERNGIHLIHIFEDEWLNKKDIVKSRLCSVFELNKRIYARKCTIELVKNKEDIGFFNNTHLQGYVKSDITIGAKYNNEYIAMMSFGSNRIATNLKKDAVEMIRFSSKLNLTVVGIASKLFNYYLKTYKPTDIISFADRKWTYNPKHCLYSNLGFNYIGMTKPNYFYMKDHTKRLHRYNFIKSKLIAEGYDSKLTEWEIMKLKGYDRIFDCGNYKFELTIDKVN